MKKTILGISGSHHKEDSQSLALLKRALRAANNRGIKTELEILEQNNFIQNIFSNKKDEIIKYYQDKLRSASGLIIATPTHWFNVSVQIKTFIDVVFWDFSDEPFELLGKPLGLIATCNEDGANQAMASIALPLNYCGLFVPPFGMLIHNLSMPKHGEKGWQNDAESIGEAVVDYLG
jgi:multimeric flavodoxin WrbA